MRREWSAEELIACWTLVDEDWALLGNKTGATRLGFGVLLKYFELEARFPRHAGDVPRPAIDYLAQQVKVPTEQFAGYDWSGRAIKYHRAQIRQALGFREATVGDEVKLAAWLAEQVCPVELSEDRLREALVARCRAERMEPPASSRLDRVVGTARAGFDQRFTTEVASRLTGPVTAGLEAFVAEADEAGFLAELKADPAKPGIETLLVEIDKLARVKAVGLPAELFSGFSEKLVDAWRARAARLYPSDLRASPAPVRLTLLAALCWARQTEIVDGLVDLLIILVHKVDATAERKVGTELLDNLRRVRGKEGILFAVAEAA
ncbi:MAG: DUF4158 domain-containing protein, partial [Acidimicrobiia bacterium]